MKSFTIKGIKAAVIFVGIGIFLSEPATFAKAQDRILHFPKDHSLGILSIHDEGEELWDDWKGWEELCQAQGDVSIPKGKELRLQVTENTLKNISDLASFGAEDIQYLYLYSRKIQASDLSHIQGLTGIKSLYINGDNLFPCPMTGDGLAYLKDLNSLRRLSICYTQIDDQSLVHLKNLKSVEELVLYGDQKIKGDGFVHIKDLPLLRSISMYRMNINDAGLEHLKELPHLKSINFQSVTLPENALEYFKEMAELDYLMLSGCKGMTGKNLAQLSKLKKLKSLTLPPETTDEGLAGLKGLDSLETLYIVGTQVTDNGLAHLKNMAGLKSLTIHSQDISGKGLIYLNDMPQLQETGLLLSQMDDEGMKYLKGMIAVTSLNLKDNRISDAGLTNIGGLTSLETLFLDNTQITDDGMVYLKNLTRLRQLRISDTQVTDTGLDNIKRLTSLENLHLDKTQITDAGLVNLQGLSALITLNLRQTNVSDAGLVHLRGLNSLETLFLDKTNVSGDGLVHLKNMKSLRMLYLYGNDINKVGFNYLKEMKKLQYLGLGEVPEDELKSLDEALPNCSIYYSSAKPAQPPSLLGKSLMELKELGVELQPSDMTDKIIFVCFIDIGQRPSRNCILEISKKAKEIKEKGIVIIAVQATKIEKEKLNEWIKGNNISFPIGMIEGNPEKIQFSWGVKSLPWLILTDRKHIVIAEGFNIDELDEKIGQ